MGLHGAVRGAFSLPLHFPPDYLDLKIFYNEYSNSMVEKTIRI